jgi:hypothetical protein
MLGINLSHVYALVKALIRSAHVHRVRLESCVIMQISYMCKRELVSAWRSTRRRQPRRALQRVVLALRRAGSCGL